MTTSLFPSRARLAFLLVLAAILTCLCPFPLCASEAEQKLVLDSSHPDSGWKERVKADAVEFRLDYDQLRKLGIPLESLPAGSIVLERPPYFSASKETVQIFAAAFAATLLTCSFLRWRSRRALRRSEKRFRSVFESAAAAMAIATPQGALLQVNPAACRILGYTEEELLRLSMYEVTHPEDRPTMEHLYGELLAGSLEVLDYEKRYLAKDDTVLWGHAKVSCVRDCKGRPLYLVGQIQDINERKKAEESLKKREAHLKAIYDNIAAGIGITDADGRLIEVNDRWAEMLGFNRDEAIGMAPVEMTDEKDRDKSREKLRALIAGDIDSYRIEKQYRRKDGEAFWADLSVTKIVGEGGKLEATVGVIFDITERKRAEKELHSAHRQLQDITEFLPDATFVVDGSKKVVAWNLAIEEKTGVLKEEIIGRGSGACAAALYGEEGPILIDLIGGSDPESEALYDFVEKRGDTLFAERFMPSLHGGRGAHAWIKASPLRDPEGNIVGAIESIRDISARKEAEEELREANRELDAFVYTVSHDLRTPLTPIIGYADFLRQSCRERLDEQELHCLAEITSSGNKMLALMEDLLTLAKAGRVERPEEPVDAGEVVQEVIAELEERIARTSLTVERKPMPSLRIRRPHLAQLFDNLIGNALRYAGEEGGPIETGGVRRDDRVLFYVRDRGPGIPEKERGRIFDVFYRGSTGKRVPGTGVGLATVQKIARLHGGRAWVEETPDGGNTFWVELEDALPPLDIPGIIGNDEGPTAQDLAG